MQVEMIKWLAYPENKPTNPVDICDIRTYQIWYQGELYDAEWVQDNWVQDNRVWGFKRDCDDELLYDGDITFWCEYMNEPDPTAKQFNFWTALEMMKSGAVCRSLVSGKHIRTPKDFNGFIEDDGEFNSDHYIVLAEIEGLWERANAD